MESFTKEELAEAHRSIVSLVSKCEKVQPKLQQGTAQSSLLRNRVKALRVAVTLIEKEQAGQL